MQSQETRAAKTSPHSIRTTESLWLAANRRAKSEGATMGFMITEMMEGYVRGFITLSRAMESGTTTAKRGSGHSVRTTDELWKAAKRRAGQDGWTMNEVIEAILAGYSRGLLDLPKVTKQYTRPKAG